MTYFPHHWTYDMNNVRARERAIVQQSKCLCPGDCNCRYQDAPWHRFNYCGCKQHPSTVRLEKVS